MERWIRNPFLSGNNRFSGLNSGSSLQTTSSTWTRLDSSGSCFRTRPWLSGERAVYRRKEKQAKDHSSGWGKHERQREVPSSGDRQFQECLQKQGDPSRVQGELEGVDDGGAFRGDVACVGRTTRPAGTQSAGLSRLLLWPPSRAPAEQHPTGLLPIQHDSQFANNGSRNHREPQAPLQEAPAIPPA